MDQLVRVADPKHRDLRQFFREEMGDKLGSYINPLSPSKYGSNLKN